MTLEVEIPLLLPIIILWAENAWGEKQRIKELTISAVFVFNTVQFHHFTCISESALSTTSPRSHECILLALYLEKADFICLSLADYKTSQLYSLISERYFILLSPLGISFICTEFDTPYSKFKFSLPAPQMSKTSLNALCVCVCVCVCVSVMSNSLWPHRL